MKKKLIVLLGLALSSSPLLALAQGVGTNGSTTGVCNPTGDISFVICKIGSILNSIIPVLIVLGVVWFVWGVITYVIGGDEEAKKKGRDRMIWGLVGLVIIVAMWGLVGIVTKTFNVSNNTNITLPTVPTNL